MVNKHLALATLCLVAFAGCEPDPGITQVNDELRARQEKLKSVVHRYETQRDGIREEIARLRVLKGGLEDAGTNPPPIITITNQPIVVVTNQTIIITNLISSFDVTPDGRIFDRIAIGEYFHSDDVVALPYSPHEFIVKTTNGVWHACLQNRNSTNVLAFKLFKL
jgi:hypothetical protein